MIKIILKAAALVTIVSYVLLASPTIAKQPSTNEADQLIASNFVTNKKNLNFITASVKGQQDNRSQRLGKFLKKQGSPMASEAKSLVKIADKYGFDWTLLAAIAGVESTFGRFVPLGSHNAYGWHNGNFYFNSWASASEYVAKGITVKWGHMGEITPWKIGPYYAETPNWAARVSSNMSLIRAVN
ncbi:glucosaminidase domain-containing protein [Patescibacteria group bacterium]|nr:glucosaminidase domain-containing protein [Patescibacteria group bacterium]